MRVGNLRLLSAAAWQKEKASGTCWFVPLADEFRPAKPGGMFGHGANKGTGSLHAL